MTLLRPYSIGLGSIPDTWTANNAILSAIDDDLQAVYHYKSGALTTDSKGAFLI
jgi:hypothetical protein